MLAARRHRGRRVLAGLGVGCLIALVAVAVAVATRPAPSSTTLRRPAVSGRPVGTPLPLGFRLARLGGGAPVELSRLAGGHLAVINVFASWCPACARELRAFAETSRAFSGRVSFVGVDTAETDRARALALSRQAHIAFPIGVDADRRVADSWGTANLPVTFFLERSGRVAAEVLGAEDVATLRRNVERLLGELP